MQKNSDTYNKNAVDAIMANFKTPYEIGSDFAKRQANPYGSNFVGLGQSTGGAANGTSFGLPQSGAVRQVPVSWGDKAKGFLNTGTGRSLLAAGLTGGLTAAFGGSPLEIASYGAQSGARASDVYTRNLHDQDRLEQKQAQLYQKAFDNEENRRLKLEQMQTNAALRKMLADAAYQKALGLNEQKNAYEMQAQNLKRAYQIEDRDLEYERSNQDSLRQRDWEVQDRTQNRRYALEDDFRQRDWSVQDSQTARRYKLEDEEARRRYALQEAEAAYERDLAKRAYDFEQRKRLAALDDDFDRQDSAQSLQNEIEMPLLNDDIDRISALYKARLQSHEEPRFSEQRQALETEVPMDEISIYDGLIQQGVDPNDVLNFLSRRRVNPRNGYYRK